MNLRNSLVAATAFCSSSPKPGRTAHEALNVQAFSTKLRPVPREAALPRAKSGDMRTSRLPSSTALAAVTMEEVKALGTLAVHAGIGALAAKSALSLSDRIDASTNSTLIKALGEVGAAGVLTATMLLLQEDWHQLSQVSDPLVKALIDQDILKMSGK